MFFDSQGNLLVNVAVGGGGGGGGGAVTIADGADATLGAKADSAWDLSAASPSEMAILKKLALLLGQFGLDNTNEQKVSLYGKQTAAGDTAVLLDASGRQFVSLAQINGVTPQMDGSFSNRQGVSLYGKNAAAGDTPVLVDASGRPLVNIAQINGVTPQMDGASANRQGVSLYGTGNGTTGDTSIALSSAGWVKVVAQATNAIIGQVKGVDSAGTNLWAIDSSGNLSTNLGKIAGVVPGLDNTNELKISAYGKNSAAGDTALSVDSSGFLQSHQKLGGSDLSNTNPMPTQDVSQSGYVSASSPPSATTATTDTSYTFSSQVNRVILQNNTTANLNYAFDTAASAGSLLLTPGQTLIYSKKVTVVHLYTAAAQNINGSSAGNIVVLGEL